MPDYANGKIYKLVCNNTGKIYIGSTCQSKLSQRLGEHRRAFNKNLCISSKQIIEGGNYNIVLIEKYPCASNDELLKRERYYIDNLECTNKNLPCRTKMEYKKDNRLKLAEKEKQRRLNNLEEERKKDRDWNEKKSKNKLCMW